MRASWRIGLAISILLCGAVALPLYLFCFLRLWIWFALPLGAPPLSAVPALGLFLLLWLLGFPPRLLIDAEPENIWEGVAHLIAGLVIKPLMALIVGWGLHSLL